MSRGHVTPAAALLAVLSGVCAGWFVFTLLVSGPWAALSGREQASVILASASAGATWAGVLIWVMRGLSR